MLIRSIKNCARCGGDHQDLVAERLARPMAPPEAAPVTWAYWIPCPANGQPIMVSDSAQITWSPVVAAKWPPEEPAGCAVPHDAGSMCSDCLSTNFSLLEDEAAARVHPAWSAFEEMMSGRAYGDDALNSAWCWFRDGWERCRRRVFEVFDKMDREFGQGGRQ
jgi:hypothetical protein